MTKEEIKAKVDNCYQRVKEANEELDKLRTICKYEETKTTDYSWAPGHIIRDAVVCAICGNFISYSAYEIERLTRDEIIVNNDGIRF